MLNRIFVVEYESLCNLSKLAYHFPFQEDKRKMVASAFGEDHGGSSATRLTVDDLKYLFMV